MTKTSVAHPMVEILENIMHCSCFEVEHVWTDPQRWFAVGLGVIT